MRKRNYFTSILPIAPRPYMTIGLSILLFFMFLWACDDIFEPDLSGKKVVLIAPSDTISTDISTQTFYWEEVKGALSYNLQIVSPKFIQIQQFIVDTTVTSTKFTLNLTPGKYQWRVIAKNGSSSSNVDSCHKWSFQIYPTSDLTKQNVELTSPVNNASKNNNILTFQWGRLYNATDYEFQLSRNDSIKIDSSLTDFKAVMMKSLGDGTYKWKVMAKNNITNTSTQWSNQYIVTIDTKNPAQPKPSKPSDKATLTDKKVEFQWTRLNDDGGSKLSDNIYISADSLVLVSLDLSKIEYKFKLDTIGLYHTFSTTGTYFWIIRTSDAAGNTSTSDPLAIRKFTIQ